jgi:glutathione S-transferase
MEEALEARGGPFVLGDALTTADLVFVPYVERMNASLAYYKGFALRREHPAIHRWFMALEARSTYLGTQSDFHTHAHDLPPQMGGCFASGDPAQRALAARIDGGPWPIGAPVGASPTLPAGGSFDPETSQSEPADAALVALGRVLRHRAPILARNPVPSDLFAPALRCALTALVGGQGEGLMPPAGSAPGLRYLRDRISVPRDMPLHSARRLRQALEATAQRDPLDPRAQSLPIPTGHRRDQDPRPFLATLDDLAS